VLVGKLDRFAVAIRESLGLTWSAPTVNRADGVDHVLYRQVPTRCDDRLPFRKFSDSPDDLPAFGEDGWPTGAMNRAIHTTPAKKRGIGSIHDRIGRFYCDVGRTADLDRLAAIEQKPDCEARHASVQSAHFLSVSASTPGSFLPSRNSSDAPPPVEMCVILSATFAACAAATESPPPTIETAPAFSATA